MTRPRSSSSWYAPFLFKRILPLLAVLTFAATPVVLAGDQDIGSPNPPGHTKQEGSRTIIAAGGNDIWDTSDQFHFSHQSIAGSGTVTVKVESVSNANEWSKAGLMVRADTGVGAPHASIFMTPEMGVVFQWRTAAGGTTSTGTLNTVTVPILLKLERKENDFTASYSKDGKKWYPLGMPQTVVMKKSALAGMAVCSHIDGAACTATFSGFVVRR